MAQLEPCPGCQRHVRIDEPSCPFCGASLNLSAVSPRALPGTRLGRAALFTFGAAAAASAVVACTDEPEPDQEDGGDEGEPDASKPGDAGVQLDGNVAPLYGLPAWDASVPDGAAPDASLPTDGGGEKLDGNVAPVYGAPAWDAAVRDSGRPVVKDDAGFVPLYGLAPVDLDDK